MRLIGLFYPRLFIRGDLFGNHHSIGQRLARIRLHSVHQANGKRKLRDMLGKVAAHILAIAITVCDGRIVRQRRG